MPYGIVEKINLITVFAYPVKHLSKIQCLVQYVDTIYGGRNMIARHKSSNNSMKFYLELKRHF